MNDLFDKMASWGVGSLTDCELLTLLVEDETLAAALLESFGNSLAGVGAMELARLRMVGGAGLKRARLVLAAAEFGKRVAIAEGLQVDVIKDSGDVVRLFRPQLEGLAYEECWVIYLTSSNRIVGRLRVSQGGVQGTVVDYRLIVKKALELLVATQLILIHNHPSGAAVPSAQDKILTDRIAKAAALFDIRLLDHLIIAREGDFSFLREGLLKHPE